MADFLPNLWSSIFTPGPTPTLLLATNLTFASLQLLLLALLLATYSIHFLILSGLCGGLWASINWFARELIAAEAKEKEAQRIRQKQQVDRDERRGGQEEADDEDDGEETETEDAGTASMIVVDAPGGTTAIEPTTASTTSQSKPQLARSDTVRQRKPADDKVEPIGSGSSSHEAPGTDSEWEKVDDEEGAGRSTAKSS
jgi:hypothetical protein